MTDKPIVKVSEMKATDTFVMAGIVMEIWDIATLEPGVTRITVLPSDGNPKGFVDTVIKLDSRTEFELISRG